VPQNGVVLVIADFMLLDLVVGSEPSSINMSAPLVWHELKGMWLSASPMQFWWNRYSSDLVPKLKEIQYLQCNPTG